MAQCHITWDSFKNNIFKGFSHLQQHEEFVDMTLAAEGHFVKVHKSLMALASPYLKSVILSAPCQHPVVFLTNISHDLLGYILEFVYMGEVLVPVNKMDDFIVAAKALHISGLHDLKTPTTKFKNRTQPREESSNEHDEHELEQPVTLAIPRHVYNSHSFTNPNINTAPMTSNYSVYLSAPIHSQLESQTYQMDSNKDINNTMASRAAFEELIEDTHTKVVANNSQTKYNIITPSTHVQCTSNSVSHVVETGENSKTNENVLAQQGMETVGIYCEDEDSNNEGNEYMEVEANEAVDVGTYSDNIEDSTHKMINNADNATLTAVQTMPDKNYSINVEMPSGNKGPPKITIQGGVVMQPPTSDLIASNTLNTEVSEYKPNIKTVPKLVIHAGDILNKPSISITQPDTDMTPIDKSKESPMEVNASTPLYMISNKGSLQMILNRFVYGIHHQSKRGKKIRWRCIDYRHKHCKAYVDTLGEVIISRTNPHSHSFHDKKILKQGQKGIFESLKSVSKNKSQENEVAVAAAELAKTINSNDDDEVVEVLS